MTQESTHRRIVVFRDLRHTHGKRRIFSPIVRKTTPGWVTPHAASDTTVRLIRQGQDPKALHATRRSPAAPDKPVHPTRIRCRRRACPARNSRPAFVRITSVQRRSKSDTPISSSSAHPPVQSRLLDAKRDGRCAETQMFGGAQRPAKRNQVHARSICLTATCSGSSGRSSCSLAPRIFIRGPHSL